MTATTAEKKKTQIQNAYRWANVWLGNYNEAIEAGKDAKAEKCLAKAQYWLDKLNVLEGM